MGDAPSGLQNSAVAEGRVAQAVGGESGGGGGDPADDDLQARLDSLRK
jgi:charged multivesicular body protein 2A